jgi:thiol:disulfide interchange protein
VLALGRGLIFGLIVSPCVGPFAASVLIFLGTSGDPTLGALGLFVFSLGLSTLLLVMAMSAGLAARFPAPGPWLALLKHHCAFVILVMAAVNLNNLGHRALTCAALASVFGAWVRPQHSAMGKWRIVILAFGTARQRMALE